MVIESAQLVRSHATRTSDVEHAETASTPAKYPHVESGTSPSEERSLLRAFEVAVKLALTYIFRGRITYLPPATSVLVIKGHCSDSLAQHVFLLQIEEAAGCAPACCWKEHP